MLTYHKSRVLHINSTLCQVWENVPRVAVIEGDGIGPEVTRAALKVLGRACTLYGITDLELVKVPAGDSAYRTYGKAIPDESWKIIQSSDVVLKGPVGETAGEVVVKIRRGLDLYANIRPSKCLPGVECLRPNIDLVVVRENTEDVYVRAEYLHNDVAIALRVISKRASERIARVAFKIARKRRKKVTIVHKANVMTISDGLFRDTVRQVRDREFPDIELDEAYIDAAAMDIVRRPSRFDVIVTTNLFGDILTDLAAYVSGSIGIAASANIGDEKAMFEPVHGAAFDIAGKGIANPIAMILCTSWMLKWLGEKFNKENYVKAGTAIEDAVYRLLSERRKLTPDLGGSATTEEVTEEICNLIR